MAHCIRIFNKEADTILPKLSVSRFLSLSLSFSLSLSHTHIKNIYNYTDHLYTDYLYIRMAHS